jgi:hypothetical protein
MKVLFIGFDARVIGFDSSHKRAHAPIPRAMKNSMASAFTSRDAFHFRPRANAGSNTKKQILIQLINSRTKSCRRNSYLAP